MSRLLLSIDFDAVPWFGADDDVDLPDGRRAPGVGLFDWGTSDTPGSTVFSDVIWHGRKAVWAHHGLRIEDVFTSRPDKDYLAVDALVATAAACGAADRLQVAESHVEILPWLQDLGPVDQVISIDAHHDLGYHPARVAAARANGTATCEDWLLRALDAGLVDQAHITYPDWRPLDAEGYTTALPWAQPHTDTGRVTLGHHRDLRLGRYDGMTLAGIFVCRSSAWTPPWLDPAFDELVDRLAAEHDLDVDGDRPQRRDWQSSDPPAALLGAP